MPELGIAYIWVARPVRNQRTEPVLPDQKKECIVKHTNFKTTEFFPLKPRRNYSFYHTDRKTGYDNIEKA